MREKNRRSQGQPKQLGRFLLAAKRNVFEAQERSSRRGRRPARCWRARDLPIPARQRGCRRALRRGSQPRPPQEAARSIGRRRLFFSILCFSLAILCFLFSTFEDIQLPRSIACV